MEECSIRNLIQVENIKDEITEEETRVNISENFTPLHSAAIKTEPVDGKESRNNHRDSGNNESLVSKDATSNMEIRTSCSNLNALNSSCDTRTPNARNMITEIKMEPIKQEECDISNDDCENLPEKLDNNGIKTENSCGMAECTTTNYNILENILKSSSETVTEHFSENSLQTVQGVSVNQTVSEKPQWNNTGNAVSEELVKQEPVVEPYVEEPDCTIIVEENNVRTEEAIKVSDKAQEKSSSDTAFAHWYDSDSKKSEKRSKPSKEENNDETTDKPKSDDVIQVLDSDDECRPTVDDASNGVQPYEIFCNPDTPDVEVIEPEDPLAVENNSENSGQMKINFMGSVTLIDDDESNVNQGPGQRNKEKNVLELKYECTYCNKKFARPSYLKKHVRYHTGERPYECSFCQKRFIVRYSLTLHQRIHTNEKPYECAVCQKKFRLAHSLKTHMKIHSSEKRYECTQCNQKFATIHHLKQHFKFHIDVVVE